MTGCGNCGHSYDQHGGAWDGACSACSCACWVETATSRTMAQAWAQLARNGGELLSLGAEALRLALVAKLLSVRIGRRAKQATAPEPPWANADRIEHEASRVNGWGA